MRIELKNICKSYNNNVVLDNFNDEIKSGEYVCIFGASGSGKSTLLNIIGCVENVDSGSVDYYIDDGLLDYKHKKSSRKMRELYFSFIFQNFALLENETVLYNLMLSLDGLHINKVEKIELIKNELTNVSLQDKLNSKVCELSGGEQQRIAFVRAVIKKSNVILADEPTGNLDAENRDNIIKLFRDANDRGKTIILVTHDERFIEQASKVIYL